MAKLAQPLPRIRLDTIYLLWGLVSYLLFIPLLGRVPTATAIIVSGWNMIAVGLGLSCWRAWRQGRQRVFLRWVVLAGCLPGFTIVSQGYLGYGFGALVAVLTFIKTFRTWPRMKSLAAGVLLAYLGLSFYGSYMRDREQIREVVWGGNSLPERIEQLYLTVGNLEWFDPYDVVQLGRIDDRLNQNWLVGAVIDSLDSGDVEFAGGETLWQAGDCVGSTRDLAEEAGRAGSAELSEQLYGDRIRQARVWASARSSSSTSTSVRLGWCWDSWRWGSSSLSWMSWRGGAWLGRTWQGFALWYMPGLSLQAGWSFVDITASIGASVVNVLFVNHVLIRLVDAKRGGVGELRRFTRRGSRRGWKDNGSVELPK